MNLKGVTKMNLSEFFAGIDEPFLAGFFEKREESKFVRFSMAYRRFFAECELPSYHGGRLYPCGRLTSERYAARPVFSATYYMPYELLRKKGAEEYFPVIKSELDVVEYPDTPHRVGGYAFVHSIPNFARVASEGFCSYKARIKKMQNADMRRGLLYLMDGIEQYHSRILKKLKDENGDERLIAALERVPFSPASDLYEAMVCRNFVYYLDLCDNPGRLDEDLLPYYRGEDITELLEEFFEYVDVNDGWSSSIGPDYNPLTLQVLHAIKGKRRPSIELRVTEDMPDSIWEAAAEAIKAGGGSPSFYNEKLYMDGLRKTFPKLSEQEIHAFNGGGCTETMLAGISRVGSLDAGINTALVLSETITQSLPSCASYAEFYKKLMENLKDALSDTVKKLESVYLQRVADVPHPVRTLLIDDCIDAEKDFNAGGARANWSVINFAGIINVIESLLAIKELVYDKKRYSPQEFCRLLAEENENFFAELKKCPHFGTDDETADKIASEFADELFSLAKDVKPPAFCEAILPASIQFTTYTSAGKEVPATPDGRHSGDPLCDSLGAIHSNDTKGPTALLNSVSKLSLAKALGTPVLNLSLSAETVIDVLKPLVTGFFSRGGMQVQITCVSKEELIEAAKDPEAHKNLIVRIGGYSEYFYRLSPELRDTVIKRTMY